MKGKKKTYPRYFIFNEKFLKRGESTWMIYSVVKTKNGFVYYRNKDGQFGRTNKFVNGNPIETETDANDYVKDGKWKEVEAAELALII